MLSKYLTPRNAQLVRNWIPTLSLWGGTAGIGVIYFTDWKLVLQYVPWIGGKYKKD